MLDLIRNRPTIFMKMLSISGVAVKDIWQLGNDGNVFQDILLPSPFDQVVEGQDHVY